MKKLLSLALIAIMATASVSAQDKCNKDCKKNECKKECAKKKCDPKSCSQQKA